MQKLILTLYVIFTSLGLIVLKLGSNSGAPLSFINNKVAVNLNPYTVGGIVLYGLSFALYTYLISRYDLGYIIPLTSAFVYVLIFFASFVIFKESFTAVKILAIALILGGIILLNLKK